MPFQRRFPQRSCERLSTVCILRFGRGQQSALDGDLGQLDLVAVPRERGGLGEGGVGISRRQLADTAGVNHSVVGRAERGGDAKLSTWARLFEGLGYRLSWNAQELAEDIQDLLSEEADRRREKINEGLCTNKRRF